VCQISRAARIAHYNKRSASIRSTRDSTAASLPDIHCDWLIDSYQHTAANIRSTGCGKKYPLKFVVIFSNRQKIKSDFLLFHQLFIIT